MPPFDLTIALVGCFGGLLPDVLRLIKNKYKATLPAYLKRSPFWIGLILQVLLGGLMAWLLGARKGELRGRFRLRRPAVRHAARGRRSGAETTGGSRCADGREQGT